MTIDLRKVAVFAGLAILLCAAAVIALGSRTGEELSDVHERIVADYPSVAHLSSREFAELDPDNVVVFDVREENEFAVSHLEDAIHLPPDYPVDDFLADFGDIVADRTVVFYCSVGVRSSQYAEAAQEQLQELGAERVTNLERGLFGWHNEDRALVSDSGTATELIHPYDEFWGRLVERRDLLATRTQ